MPPLLIIRLAIAAIWLYEGFWCKVLGRMPHQTGIVEQVPVLGGRSSALFLVGLGYAECAIGVWILTGWHAWAVAALQTGLLIVMNTIGITFARRLIHDPAGMVLKNCVLLVLAWVDAGLSGT